MQAAQRDRWTEDEYLAQERQSTLKHEFINGEITVMGGGTWQHSAIATNVTSALSRLLRGKGCRVFNSDLRVHIPATGMYTYPDASVVCGPLQFHSKDPQALTNPLVLIEVLSESTQDYDRGAKFDHYRSIPSLCEVLFVSQNEPLIQHHRRIEPGQWLLTERRSGNIDLPALGGAIALDECYESIELLSR